MELTDRFKNAYHGLVDAYYNDRLKFYDCAACAVGSIVQRSMGYKYLYSGKWESDKGVPVVAWWNLVHGAVDIDIEDVLDSAHKQGVQQCDSTGYSRMELWDIEGVFSKQYKITGENTFETLCVLIDFLLELDGMPPLEDLHEGFKVGQEKAYELEMVL